MRKAKATQGNNRVEQKDQGQQPAPAPVLAPNTPAVAPTLDLSKYVPLSESLVAYYGGVANQAYKVQKQKGADGKMEIVITPVDQNSGRRTLRIQYQGTPDQSGLIQGNLVVDDKMSVPVTFDTKRGTNLIDPEQSKKLMEYIQKEPETQPEGGGNGGGGSGGEDANKNAPNATLEFFNPFARPAAAPTQPSTPAEALTNNPSFWEKLGDSFASSLPLLIMMLLMRSNDSSEV